MGQTIHGSRARERASTHGSRAREGASSHGSRAREGASTQGAELNFEGSAHPTPARSLWERRHSFRVQVPARASVFHKGKMCGSFAVHDVSIGGCSLSGGQPRPVGEHVDVLLHLPHRAPLALSARVQRSDALSMGLMFEHTTPIAEDCIQDVVVEAFASARAEIGQVTLVVEPRHIERQTLVRTLRELGRRAIGVATALDAVQLLVEEGQHVDTVFVEAESTSLPSLELVEYLAHNHPRIRRVLVGDGKEIAASWVAQATGEVHALLETPCDQEAVHRVLHRLQFMPNDGAVS